jgi:HSP20 family molecular chaperone IbpA
MKIEFNASLPAIQSAINVSGNNDGMRIKLDVPGSDVAQAIQLMLLSGRAFKVTITDEE